METQQEVKQIDFYEDLEYMPLPKETTMFYVSEDNNGSLIWSEYDSSF